MMTMGILGLEVPYKNDQVEGVRIEYYENGDLFNEIPYKNGELDGVAKEYYPNGNLLAETPFKNDEREGIGEYYREDGSLWLQITFSDNKAISGKCGDGRNLTDAHLHSINTGKIDVDFCDSQ